jgi:hypothetical protein
MGRLEASNRALGHPIENRHPGRKCFFIIRVIGSVNLASVDLDPPGAIDDPAIE